MKYLFIIIHLFFVANICNGQKKTTYLNSYSLQSKPTLYYTLTKWCGGNIEDFLEIESTLKANKQKFKFILLTDSLCVVDLKIGRIIQSLSPDSIIYLNYKYPLCLNSLKEKKEFTKELNKRFGLKEKYLGPAFLCIVRNSTVITFKVENRKKLLSDFFQKE